MCTTARTLCFFSERNQDDSEHSYEQFYRAQFLAYIPAVLGQVF